MACLLLALYAVSQILNPWVHLMNRNVAVGLLGGAVIASSLALMTGATSIWVVVVAGFIFVVGGTLLTAILSEGCQTVESIFYKIPTIFSEQQMSLGADENIFLQVATYYRRGRVPLAEMALKGIHDSYLQLGSQLIIDRCSEKDIFRALQWHTSSAQEQERRELRILQSMAGFAPAFGMLGTLMGLVHLLFNLGSSGLEVVGSTLGFAMITTVYGLVTSNLIVKPTAIKLEQRLREKLAWQQVKYELIMLLYDKAHPTVIQETLNAFTTGRSTHVPPAESPAASIVSACPG